MQPRWYFDLEVLVGNGDTGMSHMALRSLAMSHLHPIIKRNIGIFAIAVPSSSNKLRLFASSRDDLDLCVNSLSAIPWIRDYARISYPRAVPSDFSGNWIVYRRYRIPTLKSDRHEGERRGALRQRRLSAVVEQKMDYFKLRSSSNRNVFTLVISRSPASPPAGECFPNGYGLSSAEYLCPLPDLP